MNAWAARDNHPNGGLALFGLKPRLLKSGIFAPDEYDQSQFFLNNNDPIGEGITFENSPVEVELIRKDSICDLLSSIDAEIRRECEKELVEKDRMIELLINHTQIDCSYCPRSVNCEAVCCLSKEEMKPFFEERAKDDSAK